jgi:endoglucanase
VQYDVVDARTVPPAASSRNPAPVRGPLVAGLSLWHYTFRVFSSSIVKRWQWLVTGLVAVLVMVGGVVVSAAGTSTPTFHVDTQLLESSNPLAGNGFYTEPGTSAAIAAGQANPPNPQLDRIARTPQAKWLTNDVPASAVAGVVADYVRGAAAVGKMPTVVLYAIPHRDCGGYAAGGFADAAGYRDWVNEVAAGLGGARVGVIVEPDALTALDCLPAEQQTERLDLLRYAVQTLTANPNAAVYIDGGHSRWLSAPELADRLKAAGVDRARGFSLNVSNFFTTAEETGYGEEVSALTGGKHYVVDTSRNGAGPAPDRPLNWCNPAGRALGVAPTTDTGAAHADAYLWIKHPGESDGDCGRGDPTSGLFMAPYAIGLAQAS